MGLINLFQAFFQHMRVNLGRRNITVTQHQLNRSQISAPLKQVCGKGMPHQVRGELCRQTSPPAISRQNLPKTHSGKYPTSAVQEKPRGVALARQGSASGTLGEMVKRKYLMVGFTGLLVMVPLAVTSTNGMIKRLGGQRWRALHRLAYVAAIAGVIHYYMQVKADVRQPLASAAVLAVLLGYRLREKAKPAKPAQAAKPG